MKNPLGRVEHRENEIGREGLQELCDRFNAERERRGVRERYRVNKDGEIWKLETCYPYRAPSTERALRLVHDVAPVA